jgi:hypothetical protein
MKVGADIQPLQVKLHLLLLELWSIRYLSIIGNKLSRMLNIDEKTRSLDRTSMSKICIEMKSGDGLLNGIDIQI